MRWLALLPLALVACGGEVETITKIQYRDLPVDLEDTEWTPPIEGDPILTVGVTEDQLFRELTDGDEAPIIEGFQGGFWVHVSIRATGLGRSGKLEAALVLEGSGDEVGSLSVALRLTPTREGFSEKTQVPIALSDEWQPRFEELFDQQGSIQLSYTDDEGRVGETNVKVTFVQN